MIHSTFTLRAASYLAVFAVMLAIEGFAPFVPAEQPRGRRVVFHLGLSALNAVLLYVLMAPALYFALLFSEQHHLGVMGWLGLTGVAEVVATLVAFDLWAYCMHIAYHRVRWLWRFHRVHHSDMEIDVTTASRFHAGELVISAISKCLVILLWGPSPMGLVLFETLVTASAQFHHSNIGLPPALQDRLELVIVTPRMHRCHHALHRDCFNTNFSAILSVWDRLFRSHHWARQLSELQPIGLHQPRGAETMQWLPVLLNPFTER
jgi:sterol desaturase/sphingolipid hydroxylase (fatty acid hydroxylase superfamily)